MGQTTSRRANGATRHSLLSTTPAVGPVEDVLGEASPNIAIAAPPSSSVARTPEGAQSASQNGITWPTSGQEDVEDLERKAGPRQYLRSNPTKSTVRRRLGRMLPARFHSTPSPVKPSVVPLSTNAVASSSSSVTPTSPAQPATIPSIHPEPAGSESPRALDPSHIASHASSSSTVLSSENIPSSSKFDYAKPSPETAPVDSVAIPTVLPSFAPPDDSTGSDMRWI